MNVQEIHEALDQGKKVIWGNALYQVFKSEVTKGCEYQENHPTNINGMVLEIICMNNYFGGIASIKELDDCFIDLSYRMTL